MLSIDAPMKRSQLICYWCLVVTLTLCVFITISPKPLAAQSPKLIWYVVDTPSDVGKVIARPSEINALVIGADRRTFYAIDIPNSKVYKSRDSGVTWAEINVYLPPAALPAWDIAVAPDDPKTVAVVTNNRTQVYLSTDGGSNWVSTNVPGLGGLLIADIAMSPPYTSALGKTYDIAIGTRLPDGVANGDVWIMQLGINIWQAQGIPVRDVSTVLFSPNYVIDKTILAIASNGSGTYLCFGVRDVNNNTTNWNVASGYPVRIPTVEASPTENQIITSGLALPSDYLGVDLAKRRVYVYYDSATAADDVYRLDDITVLRLNVNITRLASIAYSGPYEGGKLLVGGRLAEANLARAVIRYTTEPEKVLPTWKIPLKPPTGGGGSGYANAQVAWTPDGVAAYCGTATAIINSAADWANPAAWAGDQWDESAFSVTKDGGKTWNQLSLIDTEVSRLGDVAASADSKTLYLTSINANPGLDGFDSVWRSTSDPLGWVWERVLCVTTGDDAIVRLNEKEAESEIVIFGDRTGGSIYHSLNQGQLWSGIVSGIVVTDLTVDSDEVLYLLENNFVRKLTRLGVAWIAGSRFYTGLVAGHTIITPVRDPKDTDYVIVGDGVEGKVAYSSDGGISFSQPQAMPVPGRIHVATDEKFEVNKTIYTASDGVNGRIYRWTIDPSLFWEELLPPNSRFYGLVQPGDVLYGAWSDGLTTTGADRTLYPRTRLPSPGEWDSLVADLPAGVIFTREPSSIKVSAKDTDNFLWAIDNRLYNWATKQGCLWNYIDTLAKAGPWTTTPAPGELLPVDPVTGRAAEIAFRWRPLPEVNQYELWIAADSEFSALLRQQIVDPPEPLEPSWILPAGATSLITGKTYYWRVRATRAATGEVIRSPWSASMFFSVKAGLRVVSPYTGPVLLSPANGATGIGRSPAFSWAPIPEATEYEFVLAKDAAMTQIVAKGNISTTAYKYDDKLDWGATYFWQVRATKPLPGSPSPVSSFTVEERGVEKGVTEAAVPIPTPLWAGVLIGVLTFLLLVMVAANFRV